MGQATILLTFFQYLPRISCTIEAVDKLSTCLRALELELEATDFAIVHAHEVLLFPL